MATALLQKRIRSIGSKSQINGLDQRVFGEKVGLWARLFGCWHENISRPFVDGKTAYRTCMDCGARKPFNPETLQTEGRFYYPPIVKKIEIK